MIGLGRNVPISCVVSKGMIKESRLGPGRSLKPATRRHLRGATLEQKHGTRDTRGSRDAENQKQAGPQERLVVDCRRRHDGLIGALLIASPVGAIGTADPTPAGTTRTRPTGKKNNHAPKTGAWQANRRWALSVATATTTSRAGCWEEICTSEDLNGGLSWC